LLVGYCKILDYGSPRKIHFCYELWEKRLLRLIGAEPLRAGYFEAFDANEKRPSDGAETLPGCKSAGCDISHADWSTIAHGGIGLKYDSTHRHGLTTKRDRALDRKSRGACVGGSATDRCGKGYQASEANRPKRVRTRGLSESSH